ncbi:hypothetical protein PR048_015223 [Dryococelus australis]|uniref:Uncharacterized protein n=1 Tax=Dryococelus australis TaxID=614101 RepID=A0ABQ9HGC4_9NEOP|nr:hypothetical protein PR048_015223 [Dryococelus australis]
MTGCLPKQPLKSKGCWSHLDDLKLADTLTIHLNALMYSSELTYSHCCLNQLGWDDPLPINIWANWQQYRDELSVLQDIQIDRCIIQAKPCTVKLVRFCDASQVVYAAVVYLCSQYADGTTLVRIMAGKTKVAQVKEVSTPQLEHCEAVLLAKLIEVVKQALTIDMMNVIAWTDSTVVLVSLASPPNGVAMIKKHTLATNPEQSLREQEQKREVNLRKLQRITASCLRFCKNCKSPEVDKIKSDSLTAEELHTALFKLVISVQSDSFKTEIQCLKNGKPLPERSRTVSLTPFIDK